MTTEYSLAKMKSPPLKVGEFSDIINRTISHHSADENFFSAV
ncbi:hypothetical protein CUS_7368 [Ruminococcus albus 8]|uniref:Uncharacterized protein n=1 Tax=Ruminococcus albus 8 TaxID=246199 RepID=E9S7Z3_RUMAL|nr:hypothetical protein CUS_7368 [Ruminococcus albus 8]